MVGEEGCFCCSLLVGRLGGLATSYRAPRSCSHCRSIVRSRGGTEVAGKIVDGEIVVEVVAEDVAEVFAGEVDVFAGEVEVFAGKVEVVVGEVVAGEAVVGEVVAGGVVAGDFVVEVEAGDFEVVAGKVVAERIVAEQIVAEVEAGI